MEVALEKGVEFLGQRGKSLGIIVNRQGYVARPGRNEKLREAPKAGNTLAAKWPRKYAGIARNILGTGGGRIGISAIQIEQLEEYDQCFLAWGKSRVDEAAKTSA